MHHVRVEEHPGASCRSPSSSTEASPRLCGHGRRTDAALGPDFWRSSSEIVSATPRVELAQGNGGPLVHRCPFGATQALRAVDVVSMMAREPETCSSGSAVGAEVPYRTDDNVDPPRSMCELR